MHPKNFLGPCLSIAALLCSCVVRIENPFLGGQRLDPAPDARQIRSRARLRSRTSP